jgi:hypothetical protein
VDDRQLTLSGHMEFLPEKFLFDMDTAIDGIEWDELKKIIGQEKGKDGQDGTPDKEWDFPLEGVMRVKSGSFRYGELEWSPFHADVSLSSAGVAIAITEANVCGVSCPGEVHSTPEGLSLSLQPVSQNQQMDSFVSCLFKGKEKITGEFDFRGSFAAQGKGDQLVESLRGTGEFFGRDGRIYHDIFLVKIYQYLNSTDVFKGKFRSIGKEGFAYDTISIDMNLEGRKLVITEALLDGTSTEMVLKGTIDLKSKKIDGRALVAPVKTIDRVVKMVPVVRGVLGGTLITIPIRIKGDLASPKVTALSPTVIGSDLLRGMKTLAKLPIKVIRPVFAGSRKNADTP